MSVFFVSVVHLVVSTTVSLKHSRTCFVFIFNSIVELVCFDVISSRDAGRIRWSYR